MTDEQNKDIDNGDATPIAPLQTTYDIGETIEDEKVDVAPPTMSANISAALCEMQKCELGAITDSKNPFFDSKYADLTSVWGVIRKPLTENGLAIMQYTEPYEGGITVVTRLCHTSGDMFETRLSGKTALDKHGKATIQGLGSLITYLRRYSISSLVGVCPIDDDAEIAVGRTHAPTPKKKTPNPPAKKFPDHRKDVAPPTPPDTPPAKEKAKRTNTTPKKDNAPQAKSTPSASELVVIHDLPKGKKLIPVNFPDALSEYPIKSDYPITAKMFDDAGTHWDVGGYEVWTDGTLVFSNVKGFVPPAKCVHVAVVFAIMRFGIDDVKKMYSNVSLFGDE